MALARPYIGFKIWIISKAQNRYEGILHTVDGRSSTLVLARVRCFGTEGRSNERPMPPPDIIYEFITFRGNDIEDIGLCEPPQHEQYQDPAIIQSCRSCFSGLVGVSACDQPAASSVLNQQHEAAPGLVSGFHVGRRPVVEKPVPTLQLERSQQRCSVGFREEQLDRRKPKRIRESTMRLVSGVTTSQQAAWQRDWENGPPPRRLGARKRRSHGTGLPGVSRVPVPVSKFDTEFDFDLSNAQFSQEDVKRELQGTVTGKDGNHEDERSEPKWYYDKAKSFFDSVSWNSDVSASRLTWAEERKRNLETFDVPGRHRRGFRGGCNKGNGRGRALLPRRFVTG